MRSVITAVVIVIGMACVEPEKGEMAFYRDPCGSIFKAALLCGRESGGADPQTGGGMAMTSGDGDPTSTCQDLCELLAACVGISDPTEIAQCVAECETEITPELRDCILREGCNYPVCFEGMGVP